MTTTTALFADLGSIGAVSTHLGIHPSDVVRQLVDEDRTANGDCVARAAGLLCTLHRGHRGDHYDSVVGQSFAHEGPDT